VSGDGHKPTSRGRSVTPDEAELWNYATRRLERPKIKSRVLAQTSSATASTSPPRAPAAPLATTQAAKVRRAGSAKAPTTPHRKSPQPLADFDRRKARQIASGKAGIDARIDLHGERQRDAHARLAAFLHSAQAKGFKTVLVVTGKGGEDRSDHLGDALGEPRRGVLRRNVPHWLEQPDLRGVVLSYATASPRHGGVGALYVQLRKSVRARD
jgi:DNA-nicking Smr family endonuclease